MSKKSFKFYTHHALSITVKQEPAFRGVLKFFKRLLAGFYKLLRSTVRIIAAIFYYPGLGVFKTSAFLKKIIGKELARTAESFAKRFKKIFAKEFANGFLLFLILSLCGWGIFKIAHFAAFAIDVKDSILNGTKIGITHLTKAQEALVAKNTAEADKQFMLAANTFSSGKEQLDEGNALMGDILRVLPQTGQAKNVLNAATLISQSGQEMVAFYNAASTIKYSAEGLDAPDGVSKNFEIMENSLDKASQNLQQASGQLAAVDPKLIPASRREEFVQMSEKLAVADTAMQNARDIFKLLQNFLIPKTNVLVLFENNNELRPGGGFIGTYGNFNLNEGKIKNLTISSIYDLDGQMHKQINPPLPLFNVNTQWYMRDSNWFADFEDSSKKVVDFYEMEGGETPQVVIAITPTVITKLLTVTGPVEVPSFHVSLNADNFVEQTQAISTISNTSPLNKPKQILADFFPLFIQKLQTINTDQAKQLLPVLLDSLEQKQIVFSAQNSDLQKQFENFDWAGKVADTDRDYLQVVSSNLGGTKTDLSISKRITLDSAINQDGSITDTLEINLKNNLPNLDGTQNTSFIRVLVPKGSTLLSENGFEKKDLNNLANPKYATDPSVEEWQKGLLQNFTSGTLVGTESNKSFFGNWITVKGGDAKTITLTYRLPFKLNSLDRHSLTLQKQIGSVNDLFAYTVHFSGKKIQWESFVPDSLETRQIKVSTPINKDYFFGFIFENR